MAGLLSVGLRLVVNVTAPSVEVRRDEYQPLATKRSFSHAILRMSCQLATPAPVERSTQLVPLVEVKTLAPPLPPV